MAKATPVSPAVTLELSSHEASALLKVLNNVGGHPTKTPRQYTDLITEALNEVGVQPMDSPVSSTFHWSVTHG